MKIIDIDGNTPLRSVKVRLSDSLFDNSSFSNDETMREVWLSGPTMGDWFVRKNYGDTRIYPLFRNELTDDEFNNLEVVEIYK